MNENPVFSRPTVVPFAENPVFHACGQSSYTGAQVYWIRFWRGLRFGRTAVRYCEGNLAPSETRNSVSPFQQMIGLPSQTTLDQEVKALCYGLGDPHLHMRC